MKTSPKVFVLSKSWSEIREHGLPHTHVQQFFNQVEFGEGVIGYFFMLTQCLKMFVIIKKEKNY